MDVLNFFRMVEQVIAVDWSGQQDEDQQRENIWFCRVSAVGDIELDYGMTRDEMFGWLLALKAKSGSMLVGLDFAFSFPHAFVKEHGGTAEAFWERVAHGEGEHWINACPPPFYGRPGTSSSLSIKDREGPAFRRTDTFSTPGVQPKSPFQLAGSGHVGTGSLRGIRLLPEFQRQGFHIWPFQAPDSYTLVEIYPRIFTGAVVKSSSRARRERLVALRAEHPMYTRLSERQLTSCELNPNAFDALVSGIEMWRRKGILEQLPAAQDEITQLEGAIFAPPLVIETRSES
jgi:hypothetical protein